MLSAAAMFCGKDQYVAVGIDAEVFNELESAQLSLTGARQEAMDKLKLVMKQVPDVFEKQETGD